MSNIHKKKTTSKSRAPLATLKRAVAKKGSRKKQKPIDKYDLYFRSVQSPDSDAGFIDFAFKEIKGRKPWSVREDFCGTFAISCEWVKAHPRNIGFGVDIDAEPMEYGRQHYLSKLTQKQKDRLKLVQANVLNPDLPKVDVAIAVNFSYFIFKKREMMKAYFTNVYRNLKTDGLFICDVFGGSQCQDQITDVTKHKRFNYYWDQTGFDPITHDALFYIHFKVGNKKIEKAFTYDWRMWTIPELRDIMDEVGFKKTHVYWEGTTRSGQGNGIFSRTEKGESCESWVAYIAAEK
ncbi:MAG: class I SAM-dependent methyltransferase [Bdellovibrionota bacterium]